MAIFRIQIETVLVTEILEDKRSIREVEPRFCYRDQGYIMIFDYLEKIKFVTRYPFYVPSQVFDLHICKSFSRN